jgi:hypothetical protein
VTFFSVPEVLRSGPGEKIGGNSEFHDDGNHDTMRREPERSGGEIGPWRASRDDADGRQGAVSVTLRISLPTILSMYASGQGGKPVPEENPKFLRNGKMVLLNNTVTETGGQKPLKTGSSRKTAPWSPW